GSADIPGANASYHDGTGLGHADRELVHPRGLLDLPYWYASRTASAKLIIESRKMLAAHDDLVERLPVGLHRLIGGPGGAWLRLKGWRSPSCAPSASRLGDRGTSMTSKPVPDLLSDLAILKSHSRPKVSNDNSYSEAQFKTLQYSSARSVHSRMSARSAARAS